METKITSYPEAIYKDVWFTNMFLYYYDINAKSYEKIGHYIGIKAIEKDLDTFQAVAILEFYPIYGGELRTHKIDLSNLLSMKNIESLNSVGADVTSLNKGYVLKHIRNSLINITNSYVHTTLGFAEYQNKVIFKHYNVFHR